MRSNKKYILTPVIIPFIIGLFIGSIGYFYEGYKNENLVRELKKLKNEKNEQIDYLLEKIDEAEPFFNLEEEKRLSIEQEYSQKKRDEAQKKQEEIEKERKARREEIKLQQEERYEEELKAINSYITNIESEFNKAKSILDIASKNINSNNRSRSAVANSMKSFGNVSWSLVTVTDDMDEEEAHKSRINNILVELKHYMYDAGSALLSSIYSTDEREQYKYKSSCIKNKRFANKQLLELEKEIELYKSKYK